MKALMIVDMQNGFINEKNAIIVEKINNFAKNSPFPVNFCTIFVNNNESPFVKILKWNEMFDTEQIKMAVEINGFKTFEKSTYSISLKDIKTLKKEKIDEVYLCGTDIDGCVLATAFSLYDNNIKPFFLLDLLGTSASDQTMKEHALKIIIRSFGKDSVINSTEIMGQDT